MRLLFGRHYRCLISMCCVNGSPRWFTCFRRKRRLLLNDTDDQSVYGDVEGQGQGHSSRAYNASLQTNYNPSSLLSNSLHVSTAEMLEPESSGGSTGSLRSTYSVPWSSVTYFESSRRNSDSSIPYYSVPPCDMKYEQNGAKENKISR